MKRRTHIVKSKTEIQLFEDLKGELRGWDVKSVALSAEVAQSTIYFWLEGRTRKPRLDTVIKVAEAIGFELRLVQVSSAVKPTHLRLVK